LQAVRAAWPEYEFRIKLDQAMLDTMVKEGQWLRAKGLIKEGDPTPALYRKWLVDGPLKALDPSRVTLAP
jgi:NitT/TauT family transport system substrate-binding protein